MTEEITKTQGITSEIRAMNTEYSNKTREDTKLLDLRAGYSQHTSPLQPYTARILNVLIQMENDA